MRQDSKVTFYDLKKEYYDEDTGEYKAQEKIEHVLYCNVTDLKAEHSVQLFGKFVDSAKVVRTTSQILFNFQKLKINDKYYEPITVRYPKQRTSIVVKEVSSDGL